MLIALGRKIGGSLSKMKLLTYVWLEKEYEIIPGKPYNLERNRIIRTRPSLVQVRQIKISYLGAGHRKL